MTSETPDLAAIRARCEAATPGPWIADTKEPGDCVVWAGDVPTDDARDTALLWNIGTAITCIGQACSDYEAADCEFIAHARKDVPALLAALVTVTGERDRLAAGPYAPFQCRQHWHVGIDGMEISEGSFGTEADCRKRCDELNAKSKQDVEYHALRAEMAEKRALAAEAERERMKTVVERIMWVGDNHGPMASGEIVCRGCGRSKRHPHDAGCWIIAALAKGASESQAADQVAPRLDAPPPT